MKLLSIDVGMKNLALCLIDIKTEADYVKPLINFFKNRGSRR